MTDVEIPPGREQDPRAINEPGLGRDPERTPMPWSAAPNAGFTNGDPWLPLGPQWATDNAETQAADPDSTLYLYRRLLALRRAEPALHSGGFTPLGVQGEVVGYLRHSDGGRRFLTALNVSADRGRFDFEGSGQIVLATRRAREGQMVSSGVALGPHEAVVVLLS